MLNPGIAVPDDELTVFDGLTLPYSGINVGASLVEQHVRSAIRRPVQQLRTFQPNRDQVVLVGGGPSLNDTFDELKALYFAGAKVMTVNGAYHWCLERNIRPSAQFVIDAQPHAVRFVEPAQPLCKYFVASQCHPEVWDAVEDRPDVWMLHAGCADEPIKSLLDAHYGGHWFNVTGGTTVISRALYALRMMGFLRFHLFGVDCCWLGDAHHAYTQPENDADRMLTVEMSGGGHVRRFRCAPWHLKQLEDLFRITKIDGDLFRIAVYGDGMLAWAMAHAGDLSDAVIAPDLPAMAG